MAGYERVYIFPVKGFNARFKDDEFLKYSWEIEEMVHVRYHAIKF